MSIEGTRAEVLALMHRLETEPEHTLHVARLTLRLFDDLRPEHGWGDTDRLLLEAAACLHDIGWSVAKDGARHHKESARLIREHNWQTLDPADVNLVALIARYHRKALPHTDHAEFALLPAAEQRRVEELAALLRVGDALDRQHLQKVKSLVARRLPGKIWVKLDSPRAVEDEIRTALKKADLARRVFECEWLFEWSAPG